MIDWFARGSGYEWGAFNSGYADLYMADGMFVEGHTRHLMDRFRLQHYHYLVSKLAGIDTMEDRIVLETGCGRGAGLKYIIENMKAKYAIGLDYNQASVGYFDS